MDHDEDISDAPTEIRFVPASKLFKMAAAHADRYWADGLYQWDEERALALYGKHGGAT